MTPKSIGKDAPRSRRGAAPSRPGRRRVAGVTIPLSALRTEEDWGIGEIPALPHLAGWLKDEAGVGLIQLLPFQEISGAETSPYAALSAFAIDPMYVAASALPELFGAHVEALGVDGLATLERARAREGVDYGAVRRIKERAHAFAFRRFLAEELAAGTARARDLLAFVDARRAWLLDYALFRALKDANGGRAWWDWPKELRERRPAALAAARAELAHGVLFYEYLQWSAHAQWAEARAALRAIGVEVMGDLPFMVGRDSADVWSRQHDFKLDGAVGAPPDAFSDEGQDWDLPPYDWAAMRENDFAWLRARARHMGELFDRFRIDHLVGFFRTYQRDRATKRGANGKLVAGVFDPAAPDEQLAHGERVVRAMRDAAAEHGATLVAEDLGAVPDFVRAAITKLGVPGYRVLIWEKDGDRFRDPATYPALSVACFGTHDTAPVVTWWAGLGAAERAALLALPAMKRRGALPATYSPDVQAALFELLAAAPSELVLFLFQELVGSSARVNTPGTTGDANWTYRLPLELARVRERPEVRERLARVKEALVKTARSRT
ncbi:MAG TPA: 4-alpha-glucanotransferase [Byssovorax sp.]